MDARHHVGLALVRSVQRPGAWPARDLAVFRNQVLDEAGGDHRIHVSFLVHLAELSVPQDIAAPQRTGQDSWDARRNQLALRLAAEHFLQLDMARWGIDCWGAALKVDGAVVGPVGDEPAPRGRDARSPSRPATGFAAAPSGLSGAGGGATRAPRAPATAGPRARRAAGQAGSARTPLPSPALPGAALATIPSWVKPGKVPAIPRWIPGSNLAGHRALSATGLQHIERNALVALASLVTLAAIVVRISGAREQDAPRALNAAASTAAAAARGIPADAEGGAPERFRLIVHRSSVDGDARCDSVAAHIRWRDERMEDVRISADGRRFAFVNRPGLEGTIAPGGSISSRLVESERDGTRSAFRMWGALTPTGFRAVAETRTTTLLRWREELTCRFVAEVEGIRLRPPPASP